MSNKFKKRMTALAITAVIILTGVTLAIVFWISSNQKKEWERFERSTRCTLRQAGFSYDKMLFTSRRFLSVNSRQRRVIFECTNVNHAVLGKQDTVTFFAEETQGAIGSCWLPEKTGILLPYEWGIEDVLDILRR